MSTQTIINEKISVLCSRWVYYRKYILKKINTFIQAVRFYYDQGH